MAKSLWPNYSCPCGVFDVAFLYSVLQRLADVGVEFVYGRYDISAANKKSVPALSGAKDGGQSRRYRWFFSTYKLHMIPAFYIVV